MEFTDQKFNLYTDSGVTEYWIVNPAKKEAYLYYYKGGIIKDYRSYKGGDVLQSVCFDGLGMPLEQIFDV